jgi:hypothetical protein
LPLFLHVFFFLALSSPLFYVCPVVMLYPVVVLVVYLRQSKLLVVVFFMQS